MPYIPPSGTHRAAARANVGAGSPVKPAARSPLASPVKQAASSPKSGKARAPSPSLVSTQAASPSFSTIFASKPSSPGRALGKLEIIEKYREAARQKAAKPVDLSHQTKPVDLSRQPTFEEAPAPAAPPPPTRQELAAAERERVAERNRLAEQSRLNRIRSSPKYTQARQTDTLETNPSFVDMEAAWHRYAARWDTLRDRQDQQLDGRTPVHPDDSARQRSVSQPPSPATSSSRLCGNTPPTTPGRPPAVASGPGAEKSWPSNGCGKLCGRAPGSSVGQAVFGQAPAVRSERVMPGTLDPGIGDVATAGVSTDFLHTGTGIGRRIVSGGGCSLGEEEQPHKLWGSKSKRHVEKPRANAWEGMQLSARGEHGSLIGADAPGAVWSARAGSSRGASARGKRCLGSAVDTSERLCFSEPVSPRDGCSSTGGLLSPRLERSLADKLIKGESDLEACSAPPYEALGAWSSGAAGTLSWRERRERPLPGHTFSPKKCPAAGGSPDNIGSGQDEHAQLGSVFQDYAGHGSWDRSGKKEGKHVQHAMDARIHGSGGGRSSPGPLPRGLAPDHGSMAEAQEARGLCGLRGEARSCEDVCRSAAQSAAAPALGKPTGSGEEESRSLRVFAGALASSVPLAGCADAGALGAEFFARFQPGSSGHAGSRSWLQRPEKTKGRPELSPRQASRKVTSVIPTEQWLGQDPGSREPSTPSKRNDSKRFAAALSARECPPDRPDDAFLFAYGCPSTHEPPQGKAMPQSVGEDSHPFVHANVSRDEPPQFICRRSPKPSSASFSNAAGVKRYSSCDPWARRPAPFGCDAD
mmetsp:Transcript_109288/g.296379  ORF Transcript_109288/g.296379 Transcript_109288/m.296379 type:complete len:812 (+) Transcript_109288:28-2463(+)